MSRQAACPRAKGSLARLTLLLILADESDCPHRAMALDLRKAHDRRCRTLTPLCDGRARGDGGAVQVEVTDERKEPPPKS